MARRAAAGVPTPDAPTKKVTVDLELPEGGGAFPVLEPGEYEAEIKEAKYGMSKMQNPKIDFVLEVDNNGAKAKLFSTHSLQPQALFRLRNLTDACGITVEGGKKSASFEIEDPKMEGAVVTGGNVPEFIGQWVGVIVSQEVYEGKTKNRIDEYFALDGGTDADPNAP